MTYLYLNSNEISDLKALSALTKLTFLNIKNNAIARKI
ncbi:leucine-rich repeat domain-containing protein [Nostoc sp.]